MASIFDALSGLTEESAPEAAPEAETPATVAATMRVQAPEATAVVFCGSSDWPAAAKGAASKGKQKAEGARGEQFDSPVVIASLARERVLCLAVGPCAGHALAIAASGVFAWGQNANGQLGLGKKGGWCVPGPARAPLWGVAGDAPASAAVGRAHTLVVYESGAVYAAGAGERGELGQGAKKAELVDRDAPVKVLGAVADKKVVMAAAGCDFSLACDAEGAMYSWGWSEFGKLGLGDDGCHNLKDASIKLTYTATGTPAAVTLPEGAAAVVQVACGKHHAACVTSDGAGYTWGDNGYGKLGHRDQVQRLRPTRVAGARFSTLLCNDSSTAGLGWPEYPGRDFAPQPGDGLVWVWGVLKGTAGEGATHPAPNYDVQGWVVDRRCLGMGASHVTAAGEGEVAAWAQMPVAYGQLGFGPEGPKSSYTAHHVAGLHGAEIAQVVGASGQTHFLCAASTVKDLPSWTPPTEPLTEPPAAKRKAPPKKGGAAKKKK